MAGGYDTSGYDVEPYDAEGGGLTLLPNAFLDRPSVVWALDLYLDSSFPITFPWRFDVAPLRVSTLDLYPGGVLGDVLYEARLLERPQVSRQAADSYGGVEEVDGLKCRLAARTVATFTTPAGTTVTQPLGAYPDLHVWVAAEHRGKLLVAHLLELDAKFAVVTVQQNLFRGEVTAMADDPGTVSLVTRAIDLATFTEPVPTVRVATSWAPYAPSGALGQVVPFGAGIGRRIPCVPVKGQTDESTLFAETFTADPATDALTIIGHFLATGLGPYHASSSGTLPGGLLAAVDYWVIVTTDDEFQVALTQADALTGVAVDITSAGTGTQTLTGGVAPNNAADYDLAAGVGNVGILRVWEGAASQGAELGSVPDIPVSYEVRHRDYRPNGRYLTTVRFQDQLDGVEVTADVLRVYPDVDDAVVAEWKWLTGFQDDVGGHAAVGSTDALELATTADLMATQQRYGLGGIRMNGNQWLEVFPADDFTRQTFTIEVECTPATVLTGAGTYDIVIGANGDDLVFGTPWQLSFNETNQRVQLHLEFTDGSTLTAFTATDSVVRGRPVRLTLRRDGVTGTTDLFVGRTLALTDTRAAPIAYFPIAGPLRLGGGIAPFGFNGMLGWVRYSSIARPQSYIDAAYWLWRRNGIQFLRELAAEAGRPISGASFDAAALAWDAVGAGTLRCDGYLTQENELRAVLAAMVPFRDLTFSIGANTLLEVTVAQPPTTVIGQFGHGDAYANLLSLPTRTRASLTEVPREISVRFRRPRNGGPGAFGGYEREIRRFTGGVGKAAPPLELPFVDDPVTGDTIACLRANRTMRRDTVIDLEMGHEARTLTKGGCVRLNVPSMSIVDLDLEAVQLAKGAERVSARGVPTSAADFLYTPQRLPADPADRTLQLTDLGNTLSLAAAVVGARVTLTLGLNDVQTLRPIGAVQVMETLTGAPSAWEAVAEEVADDATSYVRTATAKIATFRFAPLVLAGGTLGTVQSVVVLARMRTSAAPLYVFPVVQIPSRPGSSFVSSSPWNLSGAGFADYTLSLATDPYQQAPWQLADLNAMVIGVCPFVPGITLDLTQLAVTVTTMHAAPLAGGFVEYLRVGPTLSTPPAPLDSDPPVFAAADFSPKILEQSGTTGQVYWFWARIRDEFGRTLALIGPASVLMP